MLTLAVGQPGRRLIEQQQARRPDQTPRDLDEVAFSVRQRRHRFMPQIRNAGGLERGIDTLGDLTRPERREHPTNAQRPAESPAAQPIATFSNTVSGWASRIF